VARSSIIIICRDKKGVCNEFDFARKALIIFVLGKNVLIIYHRDNVFKSLLGQGKRLPEYVTWPGIIII
jgi:hypothetical protein